MLKKILVVDDSPLLHQMYRLVLNRYQCTLLTAMNGKEAFDQLGAHADVDLILLDINMPVMNGIQFLEKAQAQGVTQRCPIIVISTEGKEEDTIRALKLGAKGYLKKPFQSRELCDLIAKVLHQELQVRDEYSYGKVR